MKNSAKLISENLHVNKTALYLTYFNKCDILVLGR